MVLSSFAASYVRAARRATLRAASRLTKQSAPFFPRIRLSRIFANFAQRLPLNAMTKDELLCALSRFKQERIRGLLIEIDLAEKVDLYETLRDLVSETIAERRSPFVESLDWEVGDSRFKPDFLVHLFHDELHEKHLGAGDVSDLARWHTDAELAEFLELMTAILNRIAALGVEGMTLNPSPTRWAETTD